MAEWEWNEVGFYTLDLKEPKKVIKDIPENPIKITVEYKEPITVENPQLLVLYENFGDINNYNYVYIPLFKRYYFIAGRNYVANNLIEISLKEDYLTSAQDYILATTAFIDRAEKHGDEFLNDNMLPVISRRQIYVQQFPAAFPTQLNNYITVNGGDQDEQL